MRELLGVEISKQQQSSDWGAPTLSDAQQAYAASDVLYLHELKARLDVMLAREGRDDLAAACFDFLPARARLDLAAGRKRIFSRMSDAPRIRHGARGLIRMNRNIVRHAEVRLNDAPSTSRSRLGSIGAPRENAFPAALRHTTRVARLRWFMLWGVGGIVAVVAVVVGFQFAPISAHRPALRPYRDEGVAHHHRIARSSSATARTDAPTNCARKSGIQDMSTPDLFELEELDVRLDSGPDQAVLSEVGDGRL